MRSECPAYETLPCEHRYRREYPIRWVVTARVVGSAGVHETTVWCYERSYVMFEHVWNRTECDMQDADSEQTMEMCIDGGDGPRWYFTSVNMQERLAACCLPSRESWSGMPCLDECEARVVSRSTVWPRAPQHARAPRAPPAPL